MTDKNKASLKILLSGFKNKLIPPVQFSVNPQQGSYIIIGFALLVRFIQYLSNRSLWADEAVLALNIVNRSYTELLQPLDYNQAAPIGFLILEKLSIEVFGNTEYSLRLVPFMSSIISLFLFYKISRYCLRKKAIILGVLLFSSLHYLLYYSSEVKQYSSDVAIALFVALATIKLVRKTISPKKTLFLLIGLPLAVWFSHPAIFVLAGFAVMSCFKMLDDQLSLRTRLSLLLINASWICSFIGFYILSLQTLSNNSVLMESWQSAFPANLLDINWLFEKTIKFFNNPLGFAEPLVYIAMIAFCFGFWSWLKRNQNILCILMFPWIFTVIAAYLNKYPFRNRLLLFITPFIILIIAEGLNYWLDKKQFKWQYAMGIILSWLIVLPPLTQAATLVISPYRREEIRPVIEYVKYHQQADDIIYVFQRGEYQFKYYAPKYGYQAGDYIIGVDDLEDGDEVSAPEWQRYQKDLDQLKGHQRVWMIFSHTQDFPEEESLVLTYLDYLGKSLDFFDRPGAFVYLYDLS